MGWTAMSLYSIIGVALLVVAIAVVTILKIRLRKKRQELDGVIGFIPQDDPGETKTDDWELL